MMGIDQKIVQKHSGELAWPTALFAFCCFIAFVLCLALTHIEVFSMEMVFLFNVVFCYLAFTPFHEAAHGNIAGFYRPARKMESLIGHLMGAMLLGPYPSFKFIHLTHHAHTNKGSSDPDHWVAEKNFLLVLLKCFTILPYYYFYFFTSSKRSAKKAFVPALIALMICLTAASLLIYFTSFKLFLCGWFLPGVVANGCLAFVLDYLPHCPHDTIKRYKNSNVILGRIIYIISMGHSYHVVHHAWPKIPFYSYKKVYNENKTHLKDSGTPIYSSLYNFYKKNSPKQRRVSSYINPQKIRLLLLRFFV